MGKIEVIELEGGKGEEEGTPVQVVKPEHLVSTGSTLLNLALSNNPYGGYYLGSLVNLVGDSSSGKSFLCLNAFAEAVRDPRLGMYDFIYDDVEAKLQIDMSRLFGKGISKVRTDIQSDTIEDFDKSVREFLVKDGNFIYALDSFDALTDKEEKAKKEQKRDYAIKPRLASEMFRKICSDLRHQKSLLIVVSQMRDKIGVTFGEKKTRSGGRALRHYALHEVWLAVVGHVKRKEKEVGVKVRARVKKNHLTGVLREVDFQIFSDYGVDDVGSMIDWMIEEGFWKKSGAKINTGGDFDDLTRDALIDSIEGNGQGEKLVRIVGESWLEVEESIRTKRKPRYE